MSNNMNRNDLASETESAQQQMEELQLLLSSQPSDHLSSNYLPQQQQVEDDMTIDIKEMIPHCEDGLLLSNCCIYRVPVAIRDLKKEAYTPKLVSIGPFHYGNERLQELERYKQILFKRFAQRAMSSLDDLVRLIRHLEPEVRTSYSETVNLTEYELAKLTLMDASFIIELFIMFFEMTHRTHNNKLLQSWIRWPIREDLLLLENQLPFFVIERLFDKAFPYERRGSLPSFHELTYEFFWCFNIQKLEANPEVEIKHFTDLLRLFYVQGKMSERHPFSEDGSNILLYNAKALQEAGVKFTASESKCLLDLKFSGHILEIPQITVDDHTELLFRNMIAFEHCHYPYDAYITDYALIFDCLIDTYKDVDLLVHNKVVGNHLVNTNNVVLLFNDLTDHVIHLNFNDEYIDVCKRLNGYCVDPCNKMKATLRRDYCHTPWQTVASIAAIVLLFLTIVQTIFSILQVVK